MPIIKTQIRESSAVRNVISADKIKMGPRKSNINVVDVREINKGQKSDKTGLVFDYEFTMNYPLSEPKGKELGSIKVAGEIFLVDKESVTKPILDEWKKEKKITQKVLANLLNVALTEANIEAIYQAHKVNLPTPIPMPRLKAPKGSVSSAS